MLRESTAGRLGDLVRLSEPRELDSEESGSLLLWFPADCLWSNAFHSAEKHPQRSKSGDADLQVWEYSSCSRALSDCLFFTCDIFSGALTGRVYHGETWAPARKRSYFPGQHSSGFHSGAAHDDLTLFGFSKTKHKLGNKVVWSARGGS